MEDFTTFTQVGTRITVQSATEYDFDDIKRDAHDYLYKDYGRHYFDDFEIQNESTLTDIDTGTGQPGCAFFIMGLAGEYKAGPMEDFWANFGGFGAAWRHDAFPSDISFIIDDRTNGNTDACSTVTLGIAYYFTYERSGTTFTCKIYTDAARTSLHDTLTIQTTDMPLNILYAGGNWHASNKSWISGETKNLNIISTTGTYSVDGSGSEDYTAFSVTCSGTEITVESSDRILFTNLRRNATNYANRNYGVGYFTNFKHSVNSCCTNYTEQVNDGGSMLVWGVSNEDSQPGVTGWSGNGGHHLAYALNYGTDIISLNLYDWGTANNDAYNTYGGAIYYCDIERNNTTLTCKIYEDDSRTILLDTLSIVCENTAWQYLYAGAAVRSSNVRPWTDGWAEYLSLNEISVPTMPGSSGPSDGASNGEWPSPDLVVDIEDIPGSSATVCFYDGSDDSLIGCVTDVREGESAGVSWPGRQCDQTYSWYVVISVGGSSATSAIWTFTCGSCNVFTIASESYPTIHLYPPLWDTPERSISKDISRFGFWSDNWAVHDNGVDSEPLTLSGIEWIDEAGDLYLFHKKFTDIHAIMNLHEEVAISGVADCIDAYYYIKNFSYQTVKGSRRARKWTLSLEYSRERTW